MEYDREKEGKNLLLRVKAFKSLVSCLYLNCSILGQYLAFSITGDFIPTCRQYLKVNVCTIFNPILLSLSH